jgi:hypothetical protein
VINVTIHDIEKKRDYDKNWQRRKRAGLPTRTKPIMTNTERIKRRKEVRQKANNKRFENRLKQIVEKFGKDLTDKTLRCEICYGKYYPSLHRKDGQPHRLWRDMTNEEFEEMINGNDYVIICYDCHKHIHWCMKYLLMTWEEIYTNNHRR